MRQGAHGRSFLEGRMGGSAVWPGHRCSKAATARAGSAPRACFPSAHRLPARAVCLRPSLLVQHPLYPPSLWAPDLFTEAERQRMRELSEQRDFPEDLATYRQLAAGAGFAQVTRGRPAVALHTARS